MNRSVLLYSLYISFTCAVFFHIYAYTGFTLGWMNFVILALFFGTGSKLKDIPAIFLNILAGLTWGQLNFIFPDMFTGMGVPEQLAIFLNVVIVTTIAMFIHLRVLGNTILNKIPFIFICIALTSSQGGNNEIELIITVFVCIIISYSLWSR
ncbi:DUF1097 family protein [Paenibacillus sp. Marseille-Q7038]